MNVTEAVKKRRSYRAIERIEADDGLIKDLAYHACLAPSCFNKQPWRFVFVRNVEKLHDSLSKGNEWAKNSGLIAAVYSSREEDCVLGEREYHLFDTGMAAAFLILRATELGLVAHPIAGYDEKKAKRALSIPSTYTLITMIVIGRHSSDTTKLTDEQRKRETERPWRLNFEDFAKIVD